METKQNTKQDEKKATKETKPNTSINHIVRTLGTKGADDKVKFAEAVYEQAKKLGSKRTLESIKSQLSSIVNQVNIPENSQKKQNQWKGYKVEEKPRFRLFLQAQKKASN